MYADFDTYVKRYGDDLSPFRDEVTAARYLRAASREIDRFTFDRFGGALPEIIPESVVLIENAAMRSTLFPAWKSVS